jgi:hypothetical protein
MEGALFLVDVGLMVVLLIGVLRAEKKAMPPVDRRDLGFFAYKDQLNRE